MTLKLLGRHVLCSDGKRHHRTTLCFRAVRVIATGRVMLGRTHIYTRGPKSSFVLRVVWLSLLPLSVLARLRKEKSSDFKYLYKYCTQRLAERPDYARLPTTQNLPRVGHNNLYQTGLERIENIYKNVYCLYTRKQYLCQSTYLLNICVERVKMQLLGTARLSTVVSGPNSGGLIH